MPVSSVKASVSFLTDASSPHCPIGYVQRVMEEAVALDDADAVAAAAPELHAVNDKAVMHASAADVNFLNMFFPPYFGNVTANIL
jgi:hypothetical protein